MCFLKQPICQKLRGVKMCDSSKKTNLDRDVECEQLFGGNTATCAEQYFCCRCGGNECGCPYCFDCNACETCKIVN